MKTDARDVLLDFRTRFEESGGDLRVDAYLAERGLSDDDLVADLIAADARLRQQRGQRVRLEDYLDAMPDLATRTIPLDAAVEAALRSSIEEGDATIDAVDRLADTHTELRTLIQEAAVLGRLLPTTTREGHAAAGEGPAIEPGETIGEPMGDGRYRYLIRDRIGAGVQGEVYLAVDQRLSGDAGEALVAIKSLRRVGDEVARRRFVEEAARARRIDHPNVVRVIDRSVSDGREYIVFDYIGGGTLEAYVRERGGRLPLREAARLGAQIARGVQAAHAAGLVHGDLKPGNILLTAEGEPKVADFGVAALLRADAETDEPHGLQGNLAFMAPEQFRMDARGRSPLVDVYALGGLLYWMATGRYPRGQSIGEILTSHRNDESPAQEGDIEEIDLDLIIRRALSHDPADRQPAAASVADDLQAWLERRPIGWTRPPLSRAARLWLRRRPWSAAGVLLLMLCALGSGSAAVYFRNAANVSEARLRAVRDSLTAESKELDALKSGMFEIAGSVKPLESMRFNGADAFDMWLQELISRRQIVALDGWKEAHLVGRRQFLEQYIEKADHEGRRLQATLLRNLLGSFLIEDGAFADAAAVLDEAVGNLEQMTTPDDPSLFAARALLATAEAHLAEPGDRDTLLTLATTITDGLPRYGGNSPVRDAMLDALRRLYAPDMLDMPERLDALDAESVAAR